MLLRWNRKTAVQKGFHTAAALFPESVPVRSDVGIIFLCRAFFPDKHRAFLSKKSACPRQKSTAKTGSKYNELDMWWKVCKSYEYSKAYILSFYKYKFFWWRTEDVLVIDLVLFMIETEYNIQRKVKLSCQCLKINLN